MRSTIKVTLVVVAAGVALVASVFTAFATAPGLARAGRVPSARPGTLAGTRFAPLADCSDLQASSLAWVTLTPEHHVGKQVSSYPSGTSTITPIFQYNCVPPSYTIVSVFALNGQTVYTDKESVKPSNAAGLYGYPLATVDDSSLSDGQWAVQYFNDKTLLSSSTVTVGSGNTDPSLASSATVQGVVQDQSTQNPIEGAVVLILNPGVKLQDFLQNGQKDSDVFTAGKSDSQGAFTLQKTLQRHQAYSMVVVAQGYKPLGSDTFQVNDEADPVSITISMTK
jgi:hypothetical protein